LETLRTASTTCNGAILQQGVSHLDQDASHVACGEAGSPVSNRDAPQMPRAG